MLMGSVSTQCVENTSCPVVVVRGEARVAAVGDG
jgi:nucleotide-binding universal stress UspA family protein